MNQPIGMILAAGFGTRMQPLTQALPKPLLPFLNTPIIAYSLDHLLRAGCRHIAINLHHLGHLIEPTVRALIQAWQGRFGAVELTFVHEDPVRGTAGGIAGMWRAMGSPRATAIAINGDALMSLDLTQTLHSHRDNGAGATMVLRKPAGTHSGGVWLDDDNRVVGLRKAGQLRGRHMDFMGVHFLEPDTLDHICQAADAHPEPVSCMVAQGYIPLLGTPQAPMGIVNDDYWLALDTPALLLKATFEVMDNPALFPQAPLVDTHGHKGLTLMSTQLDGKARLAAPLFAGATTRIDAGAQVGPHAVLEGTHAAGGAKIKRSVMFGMGRVEGTWEGCVAINGKIAQVE